MVILLSALFALAGLVLVRRLLPLPRRKELLDASTRVNAVFGAIRSALTILLAFSVVIVWQQYNSADETVQREANYLGDIYWNANQLPTSQRQQMQELARSYARVVINEEWTMMEQGEHSTRVDGIIRELREINNGFGSRTITQEMLQSEGLARINDLANERGRRLHANREGIPLMLWIVLIFGGVVTVAFTYLLEMQAFWIHALSVVTLTAILALVSYTIYTIDSPFGQGIQLGSKALEFKLHEFEEFEKGS